MNYPSTWNASSQAAVRDEHTMSAATLRLELKQAQWPARSRQAEIAIAAAVAFNGFRPPLLALAYCRKPVPAKAWRGCSYLWGSEETKNSSEPGVALNQ